MKVQEWFNNNNRLIPTKLKEDLDGSQNDPDEELQQRMMSFLAENPNPSDDDVHDWAEGQQLNVHKVEAAIYAIATKFAKFWMGGLANKKGITEADVDAEELKKGIETELEHVTDDGPICQLIAKRIALDHLAELPDYYTRLAKMEGEE